MRTQDRRWGWLSLSLVATLLVAACQSGGGASPASSAPTASATAAATSRPEVGVEANRLVIGIHGPKSGPAAALTEGITAGFQLYIEDINTRGGIAGRKLEVINADDQYTVSGGAAAARQLSDKVFIAFNVVGADPAIGALPEFERTGTPYLTVALPLQLAQASNIAFLYPTPLELLAETVPSFVQSQVDPKGSATVGVMWENQDIMRDMKDHFMAVAAKAGLKVATVESFDRDAATYVPNVQRVKDKGVDLVVLLGGVAVPGVLKAAKEIGYKPTWTGAGAFTFNLFNATSGGLMEGMVAVRSGAGADLPVDYDKFIKRLRDAGRKPSPLDELAYAGWTDAKFLEQTLLRLKGELTRKRMLAVLTSGITEQDPIVLEGLPPLWYKADRHYASAAGVPSTVKGGMWIATGKPVDRFTKN